MSTAGIPQPNMPGGFNPLFLPNNYVNPSSSQGPAPTSAPNVSFPTTGSFGNPGNLPNPSSNLKDMIRNAGYLGVQQGQERNSLIPDFANLMMGFGTNAGNIFSQFANQGSPIYGAKQAEAFGQGVNQNQNASALARQNLNASGYGYTPSGTMAAMLGGMGVQGAQNLSDAYLNQLIQDEMLRLQAASGLSSTAGMFNPSSLFGPTGPTGTTQGPNAADSFAAIMSGLGIGGKVGNTGITFGQG